MSESRAVPSGKVYRQLFDAQVQLSRSLLAGQKNVRTHCLSAEDSNTHCSSGSRALCSSSSGEQQTDHDDVDDVSRLPDTVGVECPKSNIIAQLSEKKSQKHKETLEQLDAEMTVVTEACESQLRRACMDLLSFTQEVDLTLDSLKSKMEQVEPLNMEELDSQWDELEQKVKVRKSRILELNHKLSTYETQRSLQIRAVLRKYCHLLEKNSFLLQPDIHRLIHSEATMINQTLLANRRSSARLLLRLLEENLQREAGLRLHWEDCVKRCRRSRANQIIEEFRKQQSGNLKKRQISEQQRIQDTIQTWRNVTETRRDIISKMCSLVPPTCSTDLVSDWFNQLTAVNQQIDSLHTDFLQQLRCCYEQTWQDHLAELQHCEVALSAQRLSQDEVKDMVNAQLLPLIGQSQSTDEEHLAALDVYADSLARHASTLSRNVFTVVHAAALLWETCSREIQNEEASVQQRLDDLRKSQEQHIQKRKVHLDNLLSGLRQESSEDSLKTTLDKTVQYLKTLKDSCSRFVSDQYGVLDCLPSLILEELLTYSSNLSTFFHLSHTYTPNPDEMKQFYPPSVTKDDMEEEKKPEEEEEEEEEEEHPISGQDDSCLTQASENWLTEADASLQDLCDISYSLPFASSRGVVYSGPAFRCHAPRPPGDLQRTTFLTEFPVELLAETLSRMRTLFMDHVEQHFQNFLSTAGAMVTARKEDVLLVQKIQLQQLDPHFIQTHIYQPRQAELQLHLQSVDNHCQQMSDVLASCRMALKELQDSISRKNQQFSVTVSNVEDSISTVNSSQRVQILYSTLQECVDDHIKDTQCCQTVFRQTLQSRLDEVKHTTTQLLGSFRLFNEGGDFAPQELKTFQRRLKQETLQLTLTEESIYIELETFESKSLQQVKEVSSRLEEKLSFLMSEFKFVEKIQKIFNSAQIQIKAEAASSNQQQSNVSSKICELRKMTCDAQVSPDQVCSLLSSVSEELRERCQYLDYSLGSEQRPLQGDLSRSAHPHSRKQTGSALPPALLQPSRTGVDFQDDPVVGVVKSLHRWCVSHDDPAEKEHRGRSSTGHSSGQHQHRRNVSAQRRGGRSNRPDRKVQLFGPRPVSDQKAHSFSATMSSVLWKANDALMLVAEDFYQTERCITKFFLVPNNLEQWAESMQQRLLGYQEQAKRFLSTSKEELLSQLSVFDELLYSLPAILINNHEKQKEAELMEEVGGIMQKLKEMMADSEKEKCLIVNTLRSSLSLAALQSLSSREELRQQQLHSAICCSHQALQDGMRRRGDEFVTSLASLAEKFLSQLDLMTPEEIQAASQQLTDDGLVAMKTEAAIEERPATDIRTWSGISYLSTPTSDPNAPLTSVTTATTPAITTTKCTLAHVAVVKERDATLKRFEQLFRSELSRSEEDKESRLSGLQSWSEHWRQQIHTLIE